VDTLSNSQVGPPDYEDGPVSDTIQIFSEGIDEDAVDVIEPIRSKAVFGIASFGKLGLRDSQVPTGQVLAC
jgi:hypothetical protein